MKIPRNNELNKGNIIIIHLRKLLKLVKEIFEVAGRQQQK